MPEVASGWWWTNGSGEAEEISRDSQLRVLFAEPYKPWQRGSNEHTNGLLRQYYPNDTDFSTISRHHLKRTTTELNDRPRIRRPLLSGKGVSVNP